MHRPSRRRGGRRRRSCRQRRLRENRVLDFIADAITAVLYFFFGFLGTVLIPVRGIAGIGFILLLILAAVWPDAAIYALLWAFGVGLLFSLVGPRLFAHYTTRGRGRLSEIRAASRQRLRDEVPTVILPDVETRCSRDRSRFR